MTHGPSPILHIKRWPPTFFILDIHQTCCYITHGFMGYPLGRPEASCPAAASSVVLVGRRGIGSSSGQQCAAWSQAETQAEAQGQFWWEEGCKAQLQQEGWFQDYPTFHQSHGDPMFANECGILNTAPCLCLQGLYRFKSCTQIGINVEHFIAIGVAPQVSKWGMMIYHLPLSDMVGCHPCPGLDPWSRPTWMSSRGCSRISMLWGLPWNHGMRCVWRMNMWLIRSLMITISTYPVLILWWQRSMPRWNWWKMPLYLSWLFVVFNIWFNICSYGFGSLQPKCGFLLASPCPT